MTSLINYSQQICGEGRSNDDRVFQKRSHPQNHVTYNEDGNEKKEQLFP